VSDEKKAIERPALLVMLLLWVPLLMLHGIVGRDLWSWFMVPALHVPPITAGRALGLQFVVYWFVGRHSNGSGPITMKGVQVAVLTPLVVWGVGAVLHQAIR
jgi:hypothetical protein